jgi:hypothetical protein
MNQNPLFKAAHAMRFAIALVVLGLCGAAMAAPQPMDVQELAEVTGSDGVSIIMDLNVNIAKVSRSFNVDGVTTHAVLNDVGGSMLAAGITVDVKQRPDVAGSSYIDVGMPGYISFAKFGFKSSGVQTDLNTTLPANQNLGGVQLNGAGAMTGHFLIWAQ